MDELVFGCSDLQDAHASRHSIKMWDPTLMVHLLFTSVAIVVMLTRLIAMRILFWRFDYGDHFTMGAVLCAAARGAMIYVVLTW